MQKKEESITVGIARTETWRMPKRANSARAIEAARRAETLAAKQGDGALAAKNRVLREKYERNEPHRE